MNYVERDTYGMYTRHSTPTPGPSGQQGPGPTLMGAETLIGNDVFNRDFEDLGDIKEIMLDMRTGRISYAVLSFGGVFGLGEKLFAVPWGALVLDTANKRFVLDVSLAKLANAPGFDKSDWPDMADPMWERDIHAYYSHAYFRHADQIHASNGAMPNVK